MHSMYVLKGNGKGPELQSDLQRHPRWSGIERVSKTPYYCKFNKIEITVFF